jgi:hypothetical protein
MFPLKRHFSFFLLAASMLLSACAPSPTLTPLVSTSTPAGVLPTSTPSPLPSATFTSFPTQTLTPVPTDTPAPTATPLPTDTFAPTPVPTYVKLRGEVIIDQAVCHYGPGAPYLYKYGIYKGSNLEIIARVEPGDYIEVQAIGGNNPCWVNPQYMQVKGDLKDVQPMDPAAVKLPQSPYYGPPAQVSAERSGTTVTVKWTALVLKAGDDSEQIPYIVEAWVCKDGVIQFLPTGARQVSIQIEDQPGCSQPSHAFLVAAEKHGYTRRKDIPWPQAQ